MERHVDYVNDCMYSDFKNNILHQLVTFVNANVDLRKNESKHYM